MTLVRRIFLVLSLVAVGAGVWALTHDGQLGSFTLSRPVLLAVVVIAGIIAGLAAVTEAVMLMSAMQHPEPEDPPIPPPVVYKPPAEPEVVITKAFDAADQAEEYLAQTRHRISVTIEDDPDEPDDPKNPPTIA